MVTPNPVEEGADVTITNSSDPASLCEGGGDVSVFITHPDGSMSSPIPGPTPDGEGNWQFVTQLDEPGDYVVTARCNEADPPNAAEAAGPFRYAPFDLTVIGPDVPPDPGPPLILVPEPAPPHGLHPAFTG